MNQYFSVRRVVLTLVALGVLGLALPVSADEPLPFQGSADEVVTDVAPLGPNVVQLSVATTGWATHLGRFTSTATVVVDMANGTLTETRVFLAANGDRLYAVGEGTFTSATTVEGTLTFVGGTGRFEDASGQAGIVAVTPDGIHFSATAKGTIEY
jgi:hypothetical protein